MAEERKGAGLVRHLAELEATCIAAQRRIAELEAQAEDDRNTIAELRDELRHRRDR